MPGARTKELGKRAENAFLSHEDLVAELEASPLRQKNLFLGNGFNLAIGVETGYASIRDSLLEHATVARLFNDDEACPGLYVRIKERPEETEQLISRISDHYHCAFVKEILYDKILHLVGKRYNQNAVIEFLKFFERYFTTNYDPLLYLLLLDMEGKEPEQDEFYDRVKRIHDGWVTAKGDNANTPLEDGTKKLLCDIVTYKEKGNLAPKTRDDIFRVLRHIRGEPFIDLRDGFIVRKSEKGDLEWSALIAKEMKDINLFYLHGSTFFYRENGTIKKRVSDKKKNFIKFLSEANVPMCVFAADSPGKMKQIKGNEYLEHCQDRLRKIKDDLCIVGWGCGDCDNHLIACINENKSLTRLFISCHGEDADKMNKTADWYAGKFKDKEIVFWDVRTAPFCKKDARAVKR